MMQDVDNLLRIAEALEQLAGTTGDPKDGVFARMADALEAYNASKEETEPVSEPA